MRDIRENAPLEEQAIIIQAHFIPDTWEISCRICNETVASISSDKDAFGDLLIGSGWRYDAHTGLPLCPACAGNVDVARFRTASS